MFCDENQLRDDTRSYWNDPEKTLEDYYIRDLLRRELQCARQREAIEKADCDLLVLLVGYSMEPLLQAVCAFEPKEQIFLVLNKQYDQKGGGKVSGKRFGKRVQKVISLLPQSLLNRQSFSTNEIDRAETADQPAAVFRLLQEKLKEPLKSGKKIIIDITGAKKSMVAGAFLYAAYSGIPISYVDFDVYDPDKGKPFGYTCRIGLLREPYKAFRLREWERIGQLYQRYQFRAARDILGWTDSEKKRHPGLIDWMEEEKGGERYFSPEQIHSAKQLAVVLEMYELWDNGDFYHAHKKAPDLPAGLTFPLAVQKLGSFWPYADPKASPKDAAKELLKGLEQIETGEKALPTKADHFTIYCCDEVAKIERLIDFNEDYRSALLRAIGLGESLLKARWVSLWFCKDNDKVEVAISPEGPYTLLKDAPQVIQDRKDELDKETLEAYRATQLIPGLRYSDKGKKKYRKKYSIFACKRDADGSLTDCVYLRRASATPRLEEKVLFGNLTNLRNKAIHTYLSVPKSVAQKALDITKASLKDYKENWAILLDSELADKVGSDSDYESLSWDELCELCGIDFLPPVPSAPKKEAA